MSRPLAGVWIFICIWLASVIIGSLLLFRPNLTPLSALTAVKSRYTQLNPNPCALQLSGGIPDAPPPDGHFQVNIDCGSEPKSNNYLRFGAFSSPVTVQSAIQLLSELNSFSLTFSPYLTLGKLATEQGRDWTVYLNSAPITDLSSTFNPGDVITLIYD
jgi:hypothetical protein